jgi:hypothetical protein
MRDRKLWPCSTWAGLAIICLFSFLTPCFGQEIGCAYDRSQPSLENAQKEYRKTNYRCAKLELLDVLEIDSIGDRTRADAHIWLGMVYYRSLKDQVEKLDSVLTQFIRALEQDPVYRGPFESDSTSEMGRLFGRAEDSLFKIEDWNTQLSAKAREDTCKQYERAKKTNKLLKVATGAVIVGTVVGAVVYDGKANDSYYRYRESISPSDIESAWDDYKSKKNMRNVMIGAAVAAVGLEVYWFIKTPHRPVTDCSSPGTETSKIGLRVDPAGVQLTLWIPGL